MTKNLVLTTLILVLLLGACAQPAPAGEAPPAEEPAAGEAFNVTVTDGLGTEITLTERPTRIVSATLGTDEILSELVDPARIAGVTVFASDPSVSSVVEWAGTLDVPIIDTPVVPEQIIEMEPDLVFVATWTEAPVTEQLQDAGITVFVVGSFTSLQAIEDNITTIGELVGEPERAAELVTGMESVVTEVANKLDEAGIEPTTRVLYLSNDSWVAGSSTIIDDVIRKAGGINVAADLVDWNQVGEETILEMDPDVVILSAWVTPEEFVENPVFAGLKAIQEGRVYVGDDARLSATSQFAAPGILDVAGYLYPELFPGE